MNDIKKSKILNTPRPIFLIRYDISYNNYFNDLSCATIARKSNLGKRTEALDIKLFQGIKKECLRTLFYVLSSPSSFSNTCFLLTMVE